MCFMEVNETDTHLVVWREGKRVIVSFRGTDINWRDFVTDISAFQRDVSYLFGDDSNSTTSQVMMASNPRVWGIATVTFCWNAVETLLASQSYTVTVAPQQLLYAL
jgi:hypothetical protein